MKHCTPTEFQRREARNDSLKLEREEYLKKEKTKKCKRTIGQPPVTQAGLRGHLHSSMQLKPTPWKLTELCQKTMANWINRNNTSGSPTPLGRQA